VDDLLMSADEIDEFLAAPITAQLATNGPTIRPVWYQWEDGAFWLISGPWSKLFARVQSDPEVALCVDVGDFESGRVMQVCAYGSVDIRDYDVERVRRILHRYLGPDEESWSGSPDDYRAYLRDGGPPGAKLLRLKPRKLTALNLSYARTR
jgi:pyridoxamine 5'-phosphate oxidase-like protein